MKAIPNGKYILSEGENGVAPENITLKRVGKNLHVILEGSDIEHPELIIEGFYDTPGELVGKAEDGQWHEYIATSGEEKDDAAFLMDGEISPVALNAAPYANGASLDNLSFAAFALSPAMIALGALAALAAATGLGYALGKHNANNDNDKSSGSGNAGGGNDYDDGSNGGPNIPTSVVIGSVTDQRGNVINPGDHSSEKSPVFTGTGKPGNKIEVIDNGKIIDEVMIGEDGNWSWTPKPALGDGDHDIVLVERDPITGKPSLPLPGFELVVDTVAPGKAEIEDLHDEEGVSIINPPSFEIADVSVYNNEIYTNKNRPTLIGTAERNTFVDVYLNGVKVGEAEVNGQGTWRFPFPSALADDRYSFHVVNRDKAGNTGLPSSQLIINIDTVAPDEPVITVIEDGSGNPITGGTQELEPVVKGTASPSEAGAKIELRDQDGNVLGTTTVRDDGSWEVVVSPALTEGNYEIIAVITDKAGNKTEMTTPVNLEVDLTAPELPGGGSIGLPGDVLEGAWDNVEPQTGWIDPTTPTNDARPEFRGAGLEQGDTVYIIDQAATPPQVLGTAIVGSDGRWSFEPATDMGEGEHRVAIIVRDDAGNESPLSDEFVFEIDTVAPADPRPGIGPDSPFEGAWDDQGDYTGWIGADSTTDDAQPEFKGSTLNDGDIVVIYNGDRVIGSALVQANGTWSWTPSMPLLNGNYDISIAVRDAAGNESARTDSLEFTISAGGRPGVPGVDGVYNDDGAVPELIQSGYETNDNTPLMKGTGVDGTTIIIRNGAGPGNIIGTAIVNNSEWSWSPATALADGTYNLNASARDAALNESGTTGNWQIVIDTVPPVAPGAPGTPGGVELWDDVGVTGVIANNGTTDDSTPTFRGTSLDLGATVIIKNGAGTVLGTAIVQNDGRWSFPVPELTDGAHSLTAEVRDTAGNLGPASDPLNFTVDTSGVGISITRLVGDANADPLEVGSGGVINDTTPVLHGRATPNSEVSIFIDGQLFGTVTSGPDGRWSAPIALADGEKEYRITATVAGTPAPTGDFVVELDVTAPAGTFDRVIDDVGNDPSTPSVEVARGGYTNDRTPRLEGTAPEGTIVLVYDGSTLLGSTTAVGGVWTFTPSPLNEGSHALSVAYRDPVGNTSPQSTPAWNIIIDVTAPDAPVLVSIEDLFGNPITGGSTSATRPVFKGTANTSEAGSTIELRDADGNLLGSGTVGADGRWEAVINPALAEGEYEIEVSLKDKAGNTTVLPTPVNLEVDTTAPDAPEVIGIEDTSGNTIGDVTNNPRPIVVGTADPSEAGADIEIRDQDGNVVGTGVVDSNGDWRAEISPALTDGEYELIAVIIDPAGNETPMTGAPIELEVDTTPPDAPEVIGIEDTSGNTIGDVTNNPNPVVVGTADPSEAGSDIEIRDQDGNVVGTGVVDGNGDWRAEISPALTDGEYELIAVIIDPAGNETPMTGAPIELEVDTTAPDAPEVIGIEDTSGNTIGDVTNNPNPVVVGTADPSEAGSDIEIRDQDGNVVGTGVVDSNGDWRAEISPALTDGDYELIAVVIDPAGNETPMTGAPIELEVDTTPPEAPEVIGIEDTSGNTIGDVTNNPNPVVVGTADPADEGSDVEIRDQDGNVVGTGKVDESGNWRAEISPALEEGEYELIAVIVDPAGNETPMTGAPIELEVDITPPEAPEVIGIESAADASVIMPFAVISHTTNNPSPVIVGTADSREVGSRIEIRDAAGNLRGTGTVTAEGTWRAPITPALTDGSYELTAILIDRAGNATPMVDTIALTIDTVAPTLPDDGSIGPGQAFEGAWDDVGDHTGWIADSAATDDARPEFKGAGLIANAGEYVIIYNGTTVLGTTTVQADGTWTWTPGSDLADGSYAVSIAIRDAARNESARTDTLNFNISAGGTLPAAPVIGGVFDNESGSELAITNGYTKDTTPVIRGTGVNGTTVVIYNGTQVIGTATVTGGVWSLIPSPALAEGNYTLTAKARNDVGNEGAASAAVNLTVDITAPNAPVITRIENDSGAEISGSTTDRDPLFKGTADPSEVGATIELRDANGNLLGTGTVQAGGNWEVLVTPRLTVGEDYNIKAVIIDKAGNRTEMVSGVDLQIESAASIIPPTGSDSSIFALKRDAFINYNTGPLKKDTLYNSLAGVQWISTGVGDVPVTTSRMKYSPNPGGDGYYYLDRGVIQFSPGSKTEFHLNGIETVSISLNVPTIGDSWITVFDANGNFVERARLKSGKIIDFYTAPIGTSIGKIVLEVDINTVGKVELSDMILLNLTTNELQSNDNLPDLTFGIETFDVAGSYTRGIWHDLSSGLRLHSLKGGSVSNGKLKFDHSAGEEITFDFGGTRYVNFDYTTDGYSSFSVYGTDGALLTSLTFYYLETNSVKFIAPEGNLIGRIIAKVRNDSPTHKIQFDNMKWGDMPDLVGVIPTDIPLPELPVPGTEVVESFDGYQSTNKGNGVRIDGVYAVENRFPNGLTILRSFINSFGGMGAIDKNAGRFYMDSNREFNGYLIFSGGTERFSFKANNPRDSVKIYDVDNNFIAEIAIRSVTSYTAPAGQLIGKVVFDKYSGYIDDVTWTLRPAAITFNMQQEESKLLLNDEIIHLADISEEQEAIIGTEGQIDVLTIEGEDQLIDLGQLADKVQSVEVIDLTGSGNNTLNISLGDILAHGETNLFINDDTVQFMVKGNEGDVVNLDDMLNGTDPGDWAKANGVVEVAGVRYEVYTHSTVNAELLVQEGVQTNLI
ncbi:Ig-like domain-containing protein [Pantoea sp. SOD02]|uniref:Ig-like domain-containing protein n=1 Tax=Pantoea sp. SOD02 TaxID=2970818 RepID=UPI0021578668|nr:Ig-like domain-containing protein [Pantoea sp. SOD02]UVC31711.1 Ig-like domain-containing protein [Pantoea sp. SOD02]